MLKMRLWRGVPDPVLFFHKTVEMERWGRDASSDSIVRPRSPLKYQISTREFGGYVWTLFLPNEKCVRRLRSGIQSSNEAPSNLDNQSSILYLPNSIRHSDIVRQILFSAITPGSVSCCGFLIPPSPAGKEKLRAPPSYCFFTIQSSFKRGWEKGWYCDRKKDCFRGVF